jgi:hypothetical protein
MKYLALLLIAGSAFFNGCANQTQLNPAETFCTPVDQETALIQAIETTLSQFHYTIDKSDPQTGIIRTNPLPAAKWFEFWRKDNVGSFNYTEANLHSLRKIIEINISQNADNLCIDCQARVQRLYLPQKHVTSSSRAYHLFSRSASSMQNLRLNPQQRTSVTWIDLGTDVRLSNEILSAIKQKINQPVRGKQL